MVVYAVLGSAPKYMGAFAMEARAGQALVSFYDHGKAFTSLSSLNAQISAQLERHLSKEIPSLTESGITTQGD